MRTDDVDMVEVVDHRADRPGSDDDRGGQPVGPPSIEMPTDEELMAEAGVEPVYSTSEAAEFFGRSNQWLYWGLRQGVFTRGDGVVIELDRDGDPGKGRRRFTLSVIKDIMQSSYRRGNLSPEDLRTIMRRIKFAERGVEWREVEGWRYVNMGRNRHRWVHPDLAVMRDGEWVMRPKPKPKARKRG